MHSLLAQPHHDGSETYVPETPAELGDDVTVLLRVPKRPPRTPSRFATCATAIRWSHVRRSIARQTHDVWWRATFRVDNVATPYRWLLTGGDFGYAWVNAMGVQTYDVAGRRRLRGVAGTQGPDWHLESVVYQVFPDRFASSGRDVDAARSGRSRASGTGFRPDVVPRRPSSGSAGTWSGSRSASTTSTTLGVNVLYLTPVFPARSTHRYDATTFDAVDPLLGGDDAFVSLVRAAHASWHPRARRPHDESRGLGARVVRRRAGRPRARERRSSPSTTPTSTAMPAGTACRRSRSSNYESEELRERMYAGTSSVVRRWLEPPYDLDGWRIDVANMTGRLGAIDLLPEVAQRRATRQSMESRLGRPRRRGARARRARRSSPRTRGTAQ